MTGLNWIEELEDHVEEELNLPNTHPTDFELEAGVQYHDIDAINQSGLKKILRSPLHYWERYINPNRVVTPPTPALQFGTALDALVLEGEQLSVAMPDHINRRTKAGKEEYAAFVDSLPSGTMIFKKEDQAKLDEMADVILNHRAYDDLLRDATKAVLLWDWQKKKSDPILCKGELDGVVDQTDGVHVIDLKTTTDASADGFAHACGTYGYHIQAAFYMDGIWANREQSFSNLKQFNQITFTFIAIEKTPPYAIGIHQLHPVFIEQGRRQYESALAIYSDCRHRPNWEKRSSWPGYKPTQQLYLRPHMWDGKTKSYLHG